MIVVDATQISVASLMVAHKQGNLDDEQFVRHVILNSYRNILNKFKKDYGPTMFLCYDGTNNWRKQFFPEYKANRKTKRDSDDLDWNQLFGWMHQIKDEIEENFPYRVLHVEGCEADDSIAVLCREWAGYRAPHGNIVIISSDGDFVQLHNEYVKQYNPMMKKWVEPTEKNDLQRKLYYGDTGDGVPNILSDDKVFIDGRRQTPLSKKRFAEWKQFEPKKVLSETLYRNYCRNEMMIDLTKQPEEVVNNIKSHYVGKQVKGHNSMILNYLIEKRLGTLQENVQDFFVDIPETI